MKLWVIFFVMLLKNNIGDVLHLIKRNDQRWLFLFVKKCHIRWHKTQVFSTLCTLYFNNWKELPDKLDKYYLHTRKQEVECFLCLALLSLSKNVFLIQIKVVVNTINGRNIISFISKLKCCSTSFSKKWDLSGKCETRLLLLLLPTFVQNPFPVPTASQILSPHHHQLCDLVQAT